MDTAPFRVKLIRPPFEVEFEAGSIGEANSILSAEGTELQKLFGITFGAQGSDEPEAGGEASGTATENGSKPEPARRGRKPKDAAAPAPLPIPGAATPPPAPPVMTAPVDPLAIPPGLQRDPATNASPAVPAAAPPPLLPAAPPVAPAPPVSGPVGIKVIAELERRGVDDAAKKQIVDWLAMPTVALIVPGAAFNEAIDCLRFMGDDKFGGVHAALFPA